MIKTVLGIPQRAMFLSESNFKRAKEFIPERWLGDEEFCSDRRDCFNPFSVGPRSCIGIKYVIRVLRRNLKKTFANLTIKALHMLRCAWFLLD